MAPSKLSLESQQHFNKFRNQYLQLQGSSTIYYPSEKFLRDADFQEALYLEIFQEGVLKHPIPKRYQLRILKELLRRIEESITDWEEQGISDNLMTSLTVLLSQPLPPESTSALQKSYVTYTFPSLSGENNNTPASIVLLESHNILSSSGTTGLRTWEASLHLATYLLTIPSLIEGKSILELGSGLGLLSILCTKYLQATHVTCTDGSPSVMAELPTNLFLNDLQDSPKIEGKELKWGHALVGGEEAEWNRGKKIDVVLGADLVYDGDWAGALLGTLSDLFEMFPDVKVLMAPVVRNRERFEAFLEKCDRSGFLVVRIDFEMRRKEVQEGPFYDTSIPIELLTLHRKGKS